MNADRKRTIKSIALAAFLLIAAGVAEMAFTPTGISKGYLATSDSDQPSTEAVAHATGEFRIVAANLIWLNVIDKYHHEYTEHGGKWSTNLALMPYIKMITMLDPHFTEAYDVGAAILADTKQFGESQKFLAEGIEKNDQSWELNYDLAMLHAWYQKDPKAALPYANRARSLASDPFDKNRLSLFCDSLKRDAAHAAAPPAGTHLPASGSHLPGVRTLTGGKGPTTPPKRLPSNTASSVAVETI